MSRAESEVYLTVRELTARLAAYWPGRREQFACTAFMDDDINHALGASAMCYDLPYDGYRDICARLRAEIAKNAHYASALRFFDADCRIVVRRPDCQACGELYDDHTPEGRCLFAAAYYHDS